MKKSVFLLFALIPVLVFSQIEASKTEHDFGEIKRGTDRVVDFTFTNRGDEKAFLLRSAFPREFAHLFSGRELQPDSSITLRVKFNPMFKEEVDYEIPVYFSSMPDPINLEFSGEVLFIDPADNPACPSFNDRRPQTGSSFDVEFVVANKITGDPIDDARVRLIERGRQINAFSTDRDGRVVEVIPIRYFYILVEADGYLPADSSTYINRRNNFFEFELEPKEREEIEMTAQQGRPATELEANRPEAKPEEARPQVVVQPAPVENIPKVDEDDFTSDRFVHNNLVFLVDVSSSMNRSGRLDIMKAAMLELVEMLRAVDQITILTYSADTEVIVETTFVTNKEQIREMIRNISAEGFTAGSKAVQTAYSLAADHFVEGGNNQVLLVSDGVFRSSDTRRIQQSIDRYVEKKIYLSIVGLKCNPDHEEELSTFAATGGGLFVPISHFDQAGYMLTEAIRRQSRVN